MKQVYILNMAMAELLRKVSFEESRLEENPNSLVAQHKIEQYRTETCELQAMILKAENGSK